MSHFLCLYISEDNSRGRFHWNMKHKYKIVWHGKLGISYGFVCMGIVFWLWLWSEGVILLFFCMESTLIFWYRHAWRQYFNMAQAAILMPLQVSHVEAFKILELKWALSDEPISMYIDIIYLFAVLPAPRSLACNSSQLIRPICRFDSIWGSIIEFVLFISYNPTYLF